MPTDDHDDDDRPRRSRPSREDEFDDDRPRHSRDDHFDDDADDAPRRRRNSEEDDYDDRPPSRRRKSEGLAITSMILGILSIVLSCCCGLFSLPLSITAIILGFVDRSNNGPNGKSTAGIICGFISIGLMVVLLVLNLALNFNPQNNFKFK